MRRAGPALLAALSALGVTLLPGRGAASDPPKGWRGWDGYHAIAWSTGEPRDRTKWAARLAELGFTAEECGAGGDPAPLQAGGLDFYVENLVPELAFLHDRQKLYDEDWDGYTKSRDKKFLVRRPCLDDPDFWPGVKTRTQEKVKPYPARKPLLYDLRDELSIGKFASPMDYCFCPHTLRAFRKWLEGQYGTLAALNAEWETTFAKWDDVVPLTTYEAKDKERAALAAGTPENYAPWADHRAFMDWSFAQAIDRLRAIVHESDPDVPVGIEGTQMPSAWGGYDLWRLAQAIDWVEPYDITSSHAVLRSFLPRRAPVLATVFGADVPRIRRTLWWNLLHGDRGCIVWDDDDEGGRLVDKKKDDLPILERGARLAPVLKELRAIAPRLAKLEPEEDRVAIHYSQASIRAQWMLESREDKDTWPRRFSSYESTHSEFARARERAVRSVEELGLDPVFVSYEQVEKGELVKRGFKVLVLPESIAMSKKECDQVLAFEKAGGKVVGSERTATMDEHGKRVAKSPLAGSCLRSLDAAGVRGPVKVLREKDGAPVAGVAVLRFKGAGFEWIAVMRSAEVPAVERVKVVLAKKAAVKDVRAEKSLGTTEHVVVDLEPGAPLILEVR